MAAKVRDYPKSYRPAPELIFEWPGNNADVKSRQYGDLRIDFRRYKVNNRSGPYLSGVNEHTEKAAVIVLHSPNWGKPRSMIVPPSSRSNMSLGFTEKTDISVDSIDYNGATQSLKSQIIEATRSKIRDSVTVKVDSFVDVGPRG